MQNIEAATTLGFCYGPVFSAKHASDKLVEKIVKHDSWPIQPDILSPPLL